MSSVKVLHSNELPCGCARMLVMRSVPLFHTCKDRVGQPKYDEAGVMLMKEAEGIEETFCEKHSEKVVEAQLEVQRRLALGEDPNEVMKLMTGASPFPSLVAAVEAELGAPQLTDGSGSDGSGAVLVDADTLRKLAGEG